MHLIKTRANDNEDDRVVLFGVREDEEAPIPLPGGQLGTMAPDDDWGPRVGEDGSITFRLWAPSQSAVSLVLDGQPLPMERRAGGWFSVRLDERPKGGCYLFELADGRRVPDPASRFQPYGVQGPSELCVPDDFRWTVPSWAGRPWEEAVIYELHVGTFTKEGTYGAAVEHLPRLAEIGFTAVEIMPLAQFPGRRGWGYDGVFHYAPHNSYGTPDDFRRFIDAAHRCGLMVFLDVVYNHFGPEGNFLPAYAPQFFQEEDPTPWGPRIAFDKAAVRRFFVGNVLYWLEAYRLDGLRFDAIDQIADDSTPHILKEISDAVHARYRHRHVHLITENPSNGPDLLADVGGGRRLFVADWNDDFHHALHVAVTGEATGYYETFKERPWRQTKRALAEGYLKKGRSTLGTEPPESASLPPTAFVHFLQNHDQVGNRASGNRLHTMLDRRVHRLLAEVLFLSPQIPLVFMGDDHLSRQSFRFFADYTGDLARDIFRNRYKEAENFGGGPAGSHNREIADPNEWSTFSCSKLEWREAEDAERTAWRGFLRALIAVRRQHIVPLLRRAVGHAGRIVSERDTELFIDWRFNDGALFLRANAGEEDCDLGGVPGDLIYETRPSADRSQLGPWSTKVFVKTAAP